MIPCICWTIVRFRPSDVFIGTDGAIYVVDWYDPIIGDRQIKDKTGYGCIYRITPKNKTLKTPRIDLSTIEGQIEALKNPAINVRNLAFTKLKTEESTALEPVKKLLDDNNPYIQARAVWLLSNLGSKGIAVVEQLLTHKNPEIRVTAYRALKQVMPDIMPYANRLVNDPSLAVRQEVTICLRDLPLNKTQQTFINLAKLYDGKDRWYLEALGYTIDGKQDIIYPLLKSYMENASPTK